MPLENLVSVSFTQEELNQLDQAIQEIEKVLKGKTINLTPAERKQYGSIAEQNKLFVNKGKELMDTYPQHIPSFLDGNKFNKDYVARVQIESRLIRLQGIAEQMSDTKILLDHDNYKNTLSFYQHLKYLSSQNIAGIKTLYDQMRQFFKGGRRKTEEVEKPITETPAQ